MRIKANSLTAKHLCIALLCGAVLWGCQTKPTKVSDRTLVPSRKMLAQKEELQEISLNASTVVLDTRSFMDYSSSHVPESYHLPLESLFSRERGEKLNSDKLARRLALLGVDQNSQVLVIGYGREGKGEEGFLAWCLNYVGVTGVQVSKIDSLDARLTHLESMPARNVPFWSPRESKVLLADRKELEELVARGGHIPEGKKSVRSTLLDVRTEKEFFNLAGSFTKDPIPNLGAVNIPWQEFFTPEGRVNFALKERLTQLGWKFNDRIVVISEKGQRSGAVTFALQAMGFSRAANYLGGLSEFMNERRRND